ncbi:MAG: hypothetical protein JHC54_05535 [Acinetobacter sp.]|nr:hypothetical protein [Acinetobacter sp.]
MKKYFNNSLFFFVVSGITWLLLHFGCNNVPKPVIAVYDTFASGDSTILSQKDEIIASLKGRIDSLLEASQETGTSTEIVFKIEVDTVFMVKTELTWDTIRVDSIVKEYIREIRNINLNNENVALNITSYPDSSNISLKLEDELSIRTDRTCNWNNSCFTTLKFTNNNPYVHYKSAMFTVDKSFVQKPGLHYGIGVMIGPSFDPINERVTPLALTIGPYATWRFK